MDLSLDEFVTGLIWMSLILVALSSLFSRWLHRKAEKRITCVRMVCRLCGRVSVAERHGKISHCASCGKLNLYRGNGRLG